MPRPTLLLDFSVQPYSVGDTLMALAGAMAEAEEFDVVAAVPPVPHADPNMAAAHARPWGSLARLLPLLELAPVRSFTVTTEAPAERSRYRFYDDCKRVAARGRPPALRFSPARCEWADKFLARWRNVVTVNLRMNTAHHSHRNYDPRAWAEAMRLSAERLGVVFLVVGEAGEVDSHLRERPYVIVAKDYGTTLLDDLALIHRSTAHVGSTSGPMVVAMLGSAPYYFTAADMGPHLARYGGALREDAAGDLVFSWAGPRQRFSQKPESVDSIEAGIRGVLS